MPADNDKTGNGSYPVDVVRKRVKYCSIRIRRDRTVVVTVPLGMREADWQAFFQKKRPWIEKHLASMPEHTIYEYTDGEVHYLLGRKVTLHVAKGRTNHCEILGDEAFLTYGSANSDRRKILAECWAAQLSAVIRPMIARWSRVMRVQPSSVSITSTKSRWGSCSLPSGAIRFSLELSAKPHPCIESVVVHELNHLLEPSHNDRFHALMDQWLPDWRERKKLLNEFPREFY